MKRTFLIICCVFLTFSFSACSEKETASGAGEGASSDLQSEISEPDRSEISGSDSSDNSSFAQESSQPAVNPPASSVETYTANDPENKRGLSEKKHDYSFGVAKNGAPHQISLNNQKFFDGIDGVQALAVDTKSTDKRMYLTFDCGYEYNGVTAKILDVLKEKNVKAAFFCTLSYLKSEPEFVTRMINEGHIVGNHSATHPVFPDITREKMADEVYRVDDYLSRNFGRTTVYFRFPTGAYSESSLELVTSIGHRSVFWSVAYDDWDTDNQRGADYAYNTVTSRFHPGAVILLHAVSEDNAAALGRIIDEAVAEGYTFKTLDEYEWE